MALRKCSVPFTRFRGPTAYHGARCLRLDFPVRRNDEYLALHQFVPVGVSIRASLRTLRRGQPQVQKLALKAETETDGATAMTATAMTATGIADTEEVTIEDIIAIATTMIGTAGTIRTEPREVRMALPCAIHGRES